MPGPDHPAQLGWLGSQRQIGASLPERLSTLSDDDLFRIVALVAVLLLVLPAALPIARSKGRLLRLAGAWVLAGGLLVALYRVVAWWLGGGG